MVIMDCDRLYVIYACVDDRNAKNDKVDWRLSTAHVRLKLKCLSPMINTRQTTRL